MTLFKSQINLAEHECSTNWGDCIFTLLYKPTRPDPGEDIHHTVISCVGNLRLLPQTLQETGPPALRLIREDEAR